MSYRHSYPLISIFILIFANTVQSDWIKIKLNTIKWEDLSINKLGERRIFCGNFDINEDLKFHWRFNGSSILPENTQIHKKQLVFLRKANANRDGINGIYECCVKENIGNACYHRELTVSDFPKQVGKDLSDRTTLYGKEGDSYYLRLDKAKRIEGIICLFNQTENIPSNMKYPMLKKRKESKTSDSYHMRIEKLEESNIGSYQCEIRIHKKEIRWKNFTLLFGEDSLEKSSPSPLLLSSCLFILFISLFN